MPEEPLRPLQPEIAEIEHEYKRDVRITEARPKIVIIGFVLFVLLDAALVIFFIVNVIGYIISGSFTDERQVASLGANVGALHDRVDSASPLLVDDAKVLARDATTADIYAVVQNVNDDRYATFTYTFATDIEIDPQEATVLPGETKYLLATASSPSRISRAELVIDDLVWHRIDAHSVPDIQTFLEDHNAFTVSDATYTLDTTIGTTPIGRSTFRIENTTPYGYVAPTFTVLLMRGQTLAAVNTVTLSEFPAFAVENVDLRWFGSLPGTATVEVIPSINYFDESVYLAPEGTPTEDIRDR